MCFDLHQSFVMWYTFVLLQWSDEDDLGGDNNILSNLFGLDDDDDLFSRLEVYDQMPCKLCDENVPGINCHQ